MDQTAETLVTILGTAGGSAFIVAVAKGLISWLSGTAHREQIKNTNLAQQRSDAIIDRDKAEDERDISDAKRREAEEHVGILQYQLRSLGITPLKREDVAEE